MPKKPALIDAGTLLATKEKMAIGSTGSLQRGQSMTETLVDLNFKVSPEFRQRFKRLAFDAQLKNPRLQVEGFKTGNEDGERGQATSRRNSLRLKARGFHHPRWG